MQFITNWSPCFSKSTKPKCFTIRSISLFFLAVRCLLKDFSTVFAAFGHSIIFMIEKVLRITSWYQMVALIDSSCDFNAHSNGKKNVRICWFCHNWESDFKAIRKDSEFHHGVVCGLQACFARSYAKIAFWWWFDGSRHQYDAIDFHGFNITIFL